LVASSCCSFSQKVVRSTFAYAAVLHDRCFIFSWFCAFRCLCLALEPKRHARPYGGRLLVPCFSISDKLNVEDLDSSARNFFKQLEGVSLPSPLCDDVFRATMCTILMPPCNATEFAVGDYRHQKPCKFLELYLAKTCGLRLPVGDLTFGEAPDCFVPNILQEPLCSASAAAASSSPPKTKAPPKSPKSKPSKPPKVNFAHLVQDWEVAASLVEGESAGQRQNDDVGDAHSAAASKGPQATKGSAATSPCGNRDPLQYGALAEVARALDSLGAAEHAHFVYLQALLSSSVSQLPASVDVVR
jgi:hypothetical protein